jgi:hypothetical protein
LIGSWPGVSADLKRLHLAHHLGQDAIGVAVKLRPALFKERPQFLFGTRGTEIAPVVDDEQFIAFLVVRLPGERLGLEAQFGESLHQTQGNLSEDSM